MLKLSSLSTIGAAVLLAAAAGISGCGSDDDDSKPSTGGTSGTGATGGSSGSGATGGSSGSGATGGSSGSGGVSGSSGSSGSGGSSGAPCTEPISTTGLESVKVTTAPTLDGDAADWGCLPVFEKEVTANLVYTPAGSATSPSYPGLTKTKVSMRSVYTATDVYFVATWADPTKSLARYPWEKQADNSWKQLVNKDSTGHENTYYEDKFGVQWDINTSDFSAAGCYASCHTDSTPSSPTFPGKKYNNKAGETTDMWHWKSVRTEPNGQLDDKHVVYKASIANGRTNDSNVSGGYKDNNFANFAAACAADPTGALSLPCFMGPTGKELVANDVYWIFDGEKQTFADTFAATNQVAGMTTSPFVGGRGDVATSAKYANGMWTLEIKRSLTTADTTEDVQFTDLTKKYLFGVAVFDNTQINHAVHGGAAEFTFRP